jgi:hypothetical protein
MKKSLAITAAVLGLAAAAPIGSALAHPVSVRIDAPEFGVRIGVPVPRVYIPAPVVVAPPPVVYAPAPRVVPPAPVYYPAPVYRTRYESPYPRYDSYPRHHHRRYWDDRRGRWCD